jgi:hypothetical protein
VLVSAVSYAWNDITQAEFTALVTNFGAWHVANGAPGTRYEGLCSLLTLSHRANGQITMLTQSDATVPNAEQLHQDFLDAVTNGVNAAARPADQPFGEHGPMPEFFTPQRLPWLQATRQLGMTVGTSTNLLDPVIRADHRSAYMRNTFPDHHVNTFYKYLTDSTIDPSVFAMVQLHSFGGKVNAVAQDATASSHRDSFFKLVLYAQWTAAAQDGKYIAWLRAFYGELYAETGGVPVSNSVTDGCYVNYPDIDLSDPTLNKSGVPWSTLYYKSNYPRLRQIKGRWDPRNFFRHTQSIELP